MLMLMCGDHVDLAAVSVAVFAAIDAVGAVEVALVLGTVGERLVLSQLDGLGALLGFLKTLLLNSGSAAYELSRLEAYATLLAVATRVLLVGLDPSFYGTHCSIKELSASETVRDVVEELAEREAFESAILLAVRAPLTVTTVAELKASAALDIKEAVDSETLDSLWCALIVSLLSGPLCR